MSADGSPEMSLDVSPDAMARIIFPKSNQQTEPAISC